MPLPTLNFYQISFDPAPPLLQGTSLRTLSAEEMTESAELLLNTAQRQRCPFWLLDGRLHERPQPPALHLWMQEEYFPRVRAELGQQACVAFLGLPSARQRGAEATLREWNTPAVRMNWFIDETAARTWLRRCQQP
jgi:hypothetical protein